MRFTIERIRTLVLAAGVLLVVALGVFLAIGRLKSPFSRRDIPKRLGIDIEQEANGVTYTQAHGGHTLFKIHASKVVQLKNDHALLHDVKIELYAPEGNRVDRIEGNEFEYDQKAGTATAAGPVEITLMRPGVAPAIAPRAAPGPAAGGASKPSPLASAEQTASNGEIHVKTSGLTFDQESGLVTTAQRVDFTMMQGSGSSMGASYDSQRGILLLDSDVELATRRGANPVELHAGHAEFYRDSNLCNLRAAAADYRGGHAAAAEAQILFRNDGTAVRLEATGGFSLATATGGHLAAPTGAIDFNERNQPRHGRLEGGVTMNSVEGARTVHGTAPTMELEFTSQGQLRHAHLERGVEMRSQQTSPETSQQTSPETSPETSPAAKAQSAPLTVTRTWRSPVADMEFRDAGHGRVEPAALQGSGGVVITGQSQRGNAPPLPSQLAADRVNGEFGPDSELTAITGVDRASIEQTTAAGVHEFATGDRLEAHLTPPGAPARGAANVEGHGPAGVPAGAAQVQWADLEGHVTLTQTPAPGPRPMAPIRAWAGKAVYQDDGQWLHLAVSPRIENNGSQLAADKIDISRQSGEAFAHGNVKATYLESGQSGDNQTAASAGGSGYTPLGGHGPAHVIASEAQLNQSTGRAAFRGRARLWQGADSISGPVIVLDRQRQMLTAQGSQADGPVTVVLLSTSPPANQAGPPSSQTPSGTRAERHPRPP